MATIPHIVVDKFSDFDQKHAQSETSRGSGASSRSNGRMPMRKLILVLVAAVPACAPKLAPTGAAPGASSRRADVNRLYQAALANPGDDAAFQAYVETLPKYRGALVAEGDLL